MSAPPSPSGDGAQARSGAPPNSLIALVVALLALRLLLAATLHLTEDEAYYRLWAQAPALGYFDHPPMIAWWIWLGVHAVGDTPLGVRLLPALASALTTFLVFDMARLAGANAGDARRAGVWHNAMLLVAAGGFLAVPDAAAALFWVLCLWSGLRALGSDRGLGANRWWLAAGAAAGLASLSKYSALFLGPGMLIWLAWTPAGRASLRTPGPWLALALAIALFGMNVWWNAAHHWLTFAKQFGRITPHRLAPRYLVEFLATQFLLLNPFLAIFLGRLVVPAPPGTPPRPSAALFIATSLPFIGYLIVHSLHDRIQAHWPAPVYPALAAAAAFAASGAKGVWARLRWATPWFALAVCALALGCLALPLVGAPLRFDPTLPVRGWAVFSHELETLRRQNDAAWIGTTSYGLAAELMDEPAMTAPVLQISERDRWRGLSRGASADTSRPGLLVDLPRRINLAALGRCFSEVTPMASVDRGAPGERGKRYAVVLVARPRRDVVKLGCGADDEAASKAD